MSQDSRQAVEAAARSSYGRLLAWLAAQWRDPQAAEDALADAFVAALTAWPERGIPDAPDAWLLAAARRRLLERHRRAGVEQRHADALRDGRSDEDEGVAVLPEEEQAAAGIPDRRLALLYVCAHPAIDRGVRSALMLQLVLGVEVSAIAGVFLVPPTTLAQRLVRAKRRIREAGLSFELPLARDLPARTHAVLEAIYAAYSMGGESALPAAGGPGGLRAEALALAQLVVALRPDDPEALGLLSLLLHCDARRDARRDALGRFVPLHAQDPARWDGAAIAQAEALLTRAAALRRPGPFQIEAAIQSAHAQRASTGRVPWRSIAVLYRHLQSLAPTLGGEVAHAVALAESGDIDAGFALLDGLPQAPLAVYQPYWAARAHLLSLAGRGAEARDAYLRAAGLSQAPEVRTFLLSRATRAE